MEKIKLEHLSTWTEKKSKDLLCWWAVCNHKLKLVFANNWWHTDWWQRHLLSMKKGYQAFLNMWMECWRPLFAIKQHLVKPGEGKSDQNWPSFVRGDPVGSNMKAKWLTQIVASFNTSHVTFWFFLCCNILVSASYGVGNHFLGQGY